jgi:hypothetical protein
MVTQLKSPITDGNSQLANLIEQVKLVNQKIDTLIDLNTKILKNGQRKWATTGHKNGGVSELQFTPDAMSLLSLPMSLRKTVMVLYKLEKATAEDLAKETGRLRAVESAAANQLVRMGVLSKKREGRDVYFYIETPLELKR